MVGLLGLVCVLVGSGCANAGDVEAGSEPTVDMAWLTENASRDTRFAFNPFASEIGGPALMALTYAMVIDRLGTPVSRETAEIVDRSGVSRNTRVTLHYDGFSLAITDYGRGLAQSAIQYLEVVTNAEDLKRDFAIGRSSRDDVRRRFDAQAAYETAEVLEFFVPAIERDDRYEPPVTYFTVRFTFDANNRLHAVRIDQPLGD